jgi:3-oxoacyl-[acyl-carrier protein] reductase
MTDEQWTSALAINLTAPFLTCREAVRRWLPTDRKGRIVNVTSLTAYHGSTMGHSHYAAAKAGLANFTISLAREMAPHGIAVNCVAPGLMYTEMLKELIDANREKFESRVPMHRVGSVEEVASVVVFVASDRASYMTGATVDVSGGLAMH